MKQCKSSRPGVILGQHHTGTMKVHFFLTFWDVPLWRMSSIITFSVHISGMWPVLHFSKPCLRKFVWQALCQQSLYRISQSFSRDLPGLPHHQTYIGQCSNSLRCRKASVWMQLLHSRACFRFSPGLSSWLVADSASERAIYPCRPRCSGVHSRSRTRCAQEQIWVKEGLLELSAKWLTVWA